MNAVWAIVFGSRDQADRAARRVQSMHGKVHGRTRERMGPFPADTPYSALDPELLFWVHATLVDTAILVHGQWVRPLGEPEQSAYYEEMKTTARLFGTPEDAIPATLADFRAYVTRMLASPEICVTPTAREIADAVMHPPLPLVLRPAMKAANLVTAGLMPERLRRDYSLSWDPARAVALRASREWVRRIAMPLLPARLRTVPAAR